MKTYAKLCFCALLAMLLGGCASGPAKPTPVVAGDQTLRADGRPYVAVASDALAMDPPVLAGTPRLNLARDGRGPEAFVGFEDQVTSYFYVEQDDQQAFAHRDGYFDRRAYTGTAGVLTR